MSFRVMAALLFLLGGCAEKIPPVALAPAGEAPATASRPALGVAALRDLRSADERAGKQPGLLALGFWNARRGDYVTGDGNLGGRVSADVTGAVAQALSGGRFGEARLLGGEIEPDPQALLVACREYGLSWIATGTLTHLYGTLHQNAYLLLIPAIYVNAVGWDNEKTDPLGVVHLSLDVHECANGGAVFHRDFAVENRYPGVPLSEAARLALEDLLQQVRNETAVVPAHGAPAAGSAPAAPLAR